MTSSKLSTERMRVSEIRYRRLFEAARDGILILNAKTLKITEANPYMTELLGYSHDQFIGKELWEIGLFRDKAASIAAFDDLQKTGYLRYEDLPLQTASGKRREVEFVSNVYDEDGTNVIQCNIRDITEQKEYEAVLESLAAIVESSDDAIIGKDLHSVVTAWNSAAERIFGYTKEEMIGGTLLRLFPPDRIDEEVEILASIARGEIVEHFETVRIRKDGTPIDVSITTSPIRDGRGNVVGASKIVRDVTERTRAETRFRLAVESAPNAMVMADNEGEIILINAQTEVLFGYHRDELIGLPVETLVPKRFRHAHPAHRKAFADDPQVRAMGAGRDLFGLRKDGTEVPVEIGLNPIEMEGGTYVLSSIVDITGRKLAEQQILDLNADLERRVLERTTELAAANQELESFSYSVSHDLRAPLRHLNGFSLALLEDYSEKLDDVGKGYLKHIREASQEMAVLIDDVLKLARVTRTEMHREKIDLSDLAADVIAKLRKAAPERDVDIKIEQGLVATGDKRLLHILLTNLLGNAWKFTSNVAAAEISFGAEETDTGQSYFVRVNGAGFDMAYANKLFGAFQRLHTTREFEGTGIGLATVQRIINRHAGRVWAEGTVGSGATFHFTLSKELENER